MRKRLSLVFLPLLYAPISFANDAAWNCEQNKDSKEWLCVGDDKSAAKTDESRLPEQSSQPVKRTQPTLTKPYTPIEDDADIQPVVPAITRPRPTQPTIAPTTVQRTAPVTPNPVVKPYNPPVVAKDVAVPVRRAEPVVAKPTLPAAMTPVQSNPPVTAVVAKDVAVPVRRAEPVVAKPTLPAATTPVQSNPPVTAKEEFVPVRKTADTDTPAIIKDYSATSPITNKNENTEAEIPDDDEDNSDSVTHKSDSKPDTSAGVTTKMQGWNCDAKDKEENWDCQLVGTDPKGQARPVRVTSKDSYQMRLLDPAFNAGQEQTFETLTSQLKYDPWENCGVAQKKDKPKFVSEKSARDTSALNVTSDYLEVFDNEIGNYLGNVEIKRADQHSLSHIASYDSVSETLDLNGDVYYNEDELALYGRSASIKLASDKAKLRDALFISPATHLRGSSKVVYRDSKTFSRYKDVAYTSCRPGNQDWVLHASELKLNDETGKGAVKNAWIEFKGVPVFYTPYLSFPKDDRRITGFLPPSLHYTQQGGVGIYTPYYWNIAPNYDATFNPRYLTSRGLLLGGNFRYLEQMTKGDVKFEYMPNDSQLNKARYLGALTNHTVYTPEISSNVDLNYVSDKNYFAQLGNALSLPNFGYIRSSADVNYVREGISLTTRADNYQSLSSSLITLPYRRLPQINLNLNHSFSSIPMNAVMESESVYFQHGSMVNGERLNVKPSVSFPLQTASAFITPKLSLQHTEYFLSKQSIGTVGNISRTLPILSLDGGAFFEKNLNLGGSSMLHTLEPRLFYLYIPYKNQNNIPLFDTAQYDFVFNSLFRENRFSGSDRIQDANQLSVALTSRLVDSTTGREKLRLNIGDIFYFKNRRVTLNPPPYSQIETSWSSPIIAEMSSELTDHISVDTGIQWDPHVSDITRGKAAVHFINQPNEIINAGYFYRKNPQIIDRSDDIIQTDVSAHWPIYDDWSVVGRWQYSLLYNKTQEGFFGVEKENCCWRFRVVGRHYINSLVNTTGFINPGVNQSIAQGQAQTGIFFQIELKGLSGIGERLDSFFERNIYGYRKSEQ